jgi:hypothetical protein
MIVYSEFSHGIWEKCNKKIQRLNPEAKSPKKINISAKGIVSKARH